MYKTKRYTKWLTSSHHAIDTHNVSNYTDITFNENEHIYSL